MSLRSIFSFLVLLFYLLISIGCSGRKSLRVIESMPENVFTTTVTHDDLVIHVRLCEHKEIIEYFSQGEDFYHYYHLIQLRLINKGYVRYTLQSNGCSFFVPPADMLRSYTRCGYNTNGLFFSFLNAVIFFPVYAISMLKAAVEAPPYMAPHDIVVPRSFGLLSAAYVGIVIAPLLIGSLWEKSRSSYAFHEADRYIMTQRQQFSCAPFSTENIVIMTPRAGFQSPCEIALYNHKNYMVEKVSLPVKMVW